MGVGLLKAILAKEGIEAHVQHLNLELARRLGPCLYAQTCRRSSVIDLDALFTPHLFTMNPAEYARDRMTRYFENATRQARLSGDYHAQSFGDDLSLADFVRQCERITTVDIPAFLDQVVASFDAARYDIAGFSLLFGQTVAALCIAQRLKASFPAVRLILGGPACDGQAGFELVRAFRFVDAAVRGQADRTIADLVRTLRTGGPLEKIPGLVFRDRDEVRESAGQVRAECLDDLPFPDYDEYFKQFDLLGLPRLPLQIEGSRGCSWDRCTFCGRSADQRGYRTKSAARLVEEMLWCERRFGVQSFVGTDSILPTAHVRELIPALIRLNQSRPAGQRLSYWCFVRSNLDKESVRQLKAANVTIGPGIETFSDHILDLMAKGTTVCRQIQFLRWASEYGLPLTYNVIHSVPGECEADYEEMILLLPLLGHLPPPARIGPMQLVKFSPFLTDAGQYGIGNVSAPDALRVLYPDEAVNVSALARSFTFAHDTLRSVPLREVRLRFVKTVMGWRTSYRPGQFTYSVVPDDAADDLVARGLEAGAVERPERVKQIEIEDRRSGLLVRSLVTGLEAEILLFCDRVRAYPALERQWSHCGIKRIHSAIESLIARRWLYCDRRGRLVALPIRKG